MCGYSGYSGYTRANARFPRYRLVFIGGYSGYASGDGSTTVQGWACVSNYLWLQLKTMMSTTHDDAGLSEFERGLLTSIKQSIRGEGVVHTPEQIMARHRGRPVGSTKAAPKERINIRLSPDVLQHFRAHGQGWQTRIDAALRQFIAQSAGASH